MEATDQGRDAAILSTMPVLDPKFEMAESNVMLMRGGAPWTDSITSLASRIDPDASSWEIAKEIHPRHEPYERLITQTLALVLKKWAQENPLAIFGEAGLNVSEAQGYRLLSLKTGDALPIVDNWPKTANEQIRKRVLSVFVFVETDCEGGDLRFLRQKLTIDSEPGLVVSFPSSPFYPYQVRAIRSGTLTILRTWLF